MLVLTLFVGCAQRSPKNYYEVYMDVTNELRDLETFFEEEDKNDSRSIVELYEHVQHAGNILPRLYLLITVGSVYIKTKKAPAKDILFDLVELCRGVQHPMRSVRWMRVRSLTDAAHAHAAASSCATTCRRSRRTSCLTLAPSTRAPAEPSRTRSSSSCRTSTT